MFLEVGFLPVRVRRSRLIVGTWSATSGYCGAVFCEDGLVSEHVRRVRVIVGTCSMRSC